MMHDSWSSCKKQIQSFVDSHAFLQNLSIQKTMQNKSKLRNYKPIFPLCHGQILSFFMRSSYIIKAIRNIWVMRQFFTVSHGSVYCMTSSTSSPYLLKMPTAPLFPNILFQNTPQRRNHYCCFFFFFKPLLFKINKEF